MNKSTKISTVISAVALTVLGMTIFYTIKTIRSKSRQSNARMQPATYSVRTQIAEVQTLHDYVNTNGDIAAENSVAVYPDIGGRIVSTNVSLGSYVQRGDIIARIDPSEPGSNFALSTVYAPINGRIVSTPLRAGTRVSTQSAITTIGDTSRLQITAHIPERYVSTITNGLKAEITVEAYSDMLFSATVTHVSPVVDAATRTKEIILTFDKDDERIDAGMFGKVKLYTVDYDGYVAVPTDTIVTKSNTNTIFVVKDDATVEERIVTLGRTVDAHVQILSGITAGERIVVEGQRVLSDGASVNDISE
ncbi:MAG: efflux RND transporter periplasmic adaptor subunit [Treponema sp.]|nr:efflux RND transporter periplasmic adaptor subunit [Treponema sp.]